MIRRLLHRFHRPPPPEPISPEVAAIMAELDDELSREHALVEDLGPGVGGLGSIFQGFSQRCQKVALVGSHRRLVPAPKDIDILYIPKNPVQVMEFIERVADSEASIERRGDGWGCLLNGARVDFIESRDQQWGLDLLFFTGSRSFNERVRRHAERRSYRVENGRPVLSRDDGYHAYTVPAFSGWSEEKILTHLGLEDFLDPRTRSEA